MIAGIQWWVYLFIILIFLSGYMSFRAMRAERKLEQQYIESQGKIYMDRMKAEKEDKKGTKRHSSE